MSLETMTDRYSYFTAQEDGNSATIYYYVEVDSEDVYDVQYNGKFYKIYKTLQWWNGSSTYYLTYDEEFHER